MYYDHTLSGPGAALSASPVSTTASPFRVANGTWFDPSLDFRDPEGDAFTKAVLAEIATIEERDRKRRPVDQANHYQRVRKILANGFRCHWHWRPHLVSYSRKADGYKGGPAWLSGRAMASTVDFLVKAGLLDARDGIWGEVSSTYYIKPKLYGVAQVCGVTESSITQRLPSERLVRLREGNSEGPLIGFEPTDETKAWTARLEDYNAFLAQQDITLAVSAEQGAEWVRCLNREQRKEWGKSRPRLCRPETFKTDLYRTFNNGSFEQGGRLYGGWWISVPKSLRPKITINGKPTVELDYSGCAIRMLYHEHGIDYRDDPYRLEPLAAYEAETGLEGGHYREGVKAMTQAAINDTSGGKWELIALPNGLSFRPAFKRLKVRQMIEEKHAPIADAFGSGAGLRLQRKDSGLAMSIITDLKDQNIVALPIHDSFLTTEDNFSDLKRSMEIEYINMFGFHPIINCI